MMYDNIANATDMYTMIQDNIAPNAIDMYTMMYDNIANAIDMYTMMYDNIANAIKICSVCRNHNPVLSSFMTYHRVCNKRNMTGATCGVGIIYPSSVSKFTFGLY